MLHVDYALPSGRGHGTVYWRGSLPNKATLDSQRDNAFLYLLQIDTNKIQVVQYGMKHITISFLNLLNGNINQQMFAKQRFRRAPVTL